MALTKASKVMIVDDFSYALENIVANFHPAVAPDTITTTGYYTEGDGGGGVYEKASSPPAHPGAFLLNLASGSTVWYELAEAKINIRALGGVGDFATDDTQAMRDTVATAKALGRPIYFPAGSFTVTDTTIIDSVFAMEGDGFGRSIIYLNDANLPIFEIQVNGVNPAGNIEGCYVRGIEFRAHYSSDAIAYDQSAVFKVTGDDTSFFQWNDFSDLYVRGFRQWFWVTKAARVTSFGLECNVAWTDFTNITIRGWSRPAVVGWRFGTGSGTGNSFYNTTGRIGGVLIGVSTPGAVFQFTGSGHVVGDIVIDGGHWGGEAASALISIGADTVYRQRIGVNNVQLDAGADFMFGASSTGAIGYSNIRAISNNIGGDAAIGGLPPARNSQVYDQEVSEWRSGRYRTFDTTGSQTFDLFEVELGVLGSAVVEIIVTGICAGVGNCAIVQRFLIRAGTTTITEVLAISANVSPASSPPISLSQSTSGRVVKFSASLTPTAAGSNIDGQAVLIGGPAVVRRI